MSAVRWAEAGEWPAELELGETTPGTGEGGPHYGPLSDRQRTMYRFTYGLLIGIQAVLLVTLWALRVVYAGGQSPARPALIALGGAILLALAAGVPVTGRAAAAARRDEQARAAGATLAALGLGAVALGALAAAWVVFDRPSTSHLGEVWYVSTTAFGVLLAGLLVAQALMVRAGRLGRSGEMVFEAGRLQWLFLTAAWAMQYVVVWLI